MSKPFSFKKFYQTWRLADDYDEETRPRKEFQIMVLLTVELEKGEWEAVHEQGWDSLEDYLAEKAMYEKEDYIVEQCEEVESDWDEDYSEIN